MSFLSTAMKWVGAWVIFRRMGKSKVLLPIALYQAGRHLRRR